MNIDGINEQRPDAVVWLDEVHAILALRDEAGAISTAEFRRSQQPEPRYLAQIVHQLGGSEHVLILGPEDARVALERRFVAVTHRPERLMATGGQIQAGSAGLGHERAPVAA